MYIKRDEQITFAAEDYIFKCCYTYDCERIRKSWIECLIDYYFSNIEPCDEFVDVDAFTDWIHELSDEEIAEIVEG